MWIYIVGGIVILLLIAAFAVTGILFFGALRRIPPKKEKKSQIDTASLFPAMEGNRCRTRLVPFKAEARGRHHRL